MPLVYPNRFPCQPGSTPEESGAPSWLRDEVRSHVTHISSPSTPFFATHIRSLPLFSSFPSARPASSSLRLSHLSVLSAPAPSSVRIWKPVASPPLTMARKFIVGGNHKCNGTQESIKKLAEALNAATVPGSDVVEVVIAPPAVYLPLLKDVLRKDFSVAAQNCWVGKGGAFTGETSAEMLVDLGVPYVILGHSERRTLIKESNEFVADKVAYALSKGLKVIACVGESLEEREAGETMTVVAAQLQAIKDKISNWDNVVLAYEPIWAIGTGKVATPQQAEETHAEIRKWLEDNVSPAVAAATRIQYGGSVSASNCKELAALSNVDGFLVGGASLKPEFADIISAATLSV